MRNVAYDEIVKGELRLEYRTKFESDCRLRYFKIEFTG